MWLSSDGEKAEADVDRGSEIYTLQKMWNKV